jgi:hypothetical protein
VDGVLAPLVPQSGNGAGRSPTGTPAVPFSHIGDRYRYQLLSLERCIALCNSQEKSGNPIASQGQIFYNRGEQ